MLSPSSFSSPPPPPLSSTSVWKEDREQTYMDYFLSSFHLLVPLFTPVLLSPPLLSTSSLLLPSFFYIDLCFSWIQTWTVLFFYSFLLFLLLHLYPYFLFSNFLSFFLPSPQSISWKPTRSTSSSSSPSSPLRLTLSVKAKQTIQIMLMSTLRRRREGSCSLWIFF